MFCLWCKIQNPKSKLIPPKSPPKKSNSPKVFNHMLFAWREIQMVESIGIAQRKSSQRKSSHIWIFLPLIWAYHWRPSTMNCWFTTGLPLKKTNSKIKIPKSKPQNSKIQNPKSKLQDPKSKPQDKGLKSYAGKVWNHQLTILDLWWGHTPGYDHFRP